MHRRRYLALSALALLVATAALVESVTRAGRGWWRGEAFYRGRPTSYWAQELPRWPPIFT